MRLHLVCDTSGSMVEGGKPFIIRNAILTIMQWYKFGFSKGEIVLYVWADKLQKCLEWNSSTHYPAELFGYGGSSNVRELVQAMGQLKDARILLLTDGFWTPGDARQFKDWVAKLPSDTLRIVRIGADASSQLKGANVFDPEDIFCALDGWLGDAST